MDPEIIDTPVDAAPDTLRDALDAAFTDAEVPEPKEETPEPAPEVKAEEPPAEEKPEPTPPIEAKADIKAETIPQAPPIPPKKAPSS